MRRATPVFVVLVAFALRLLNLAHLGDLEFDEIVSVRYAALPLPELIPRLASALFEHPPAFYAVLGAWRALLGTDDILARLFSIVPGTLTVAVTFALGRRAFGSRAGALASFLVAVAPLTIFYSREARMYALVACLTTLQTWLFLRAISRRPRAAWWAGYAALGALTTYVHYLGALAFISLAIAAWAGGEATRLVRRPATLATLVVALLTVPWLVGSSGGRASLPALNASNAAAVPPALLDLLSKLAGGPDAFGALYILAGLCAPALAVAGVRKGAPSRAVFLSPLLANLAGVLFALLLGKPVQARYILPAVPPLYALAAHGALQLSHRHSLAWTVPATRRLQLGSWRLSAAASFLAVSGVLTLTAFGVFWQRYYWSYARADYSDVTARIAQLERQNDAVLLTGPWQAWYFDFYYPRSGGTLSHQVLPRDAPPALDPAEAVPALEALVRGRRRIWFVQAGLAQADPTNMVERWLRANAWPSLREPHQNAVLSLFALGEPQTRRTIQPTTFGDALRLAGGWVDGDEVAAGDVVRLSLDFQAVRPLQGSFKASLRLVGADGERTAVDIPLEDTNGSGVSLWHVGQRVTMRQGIFAPPSLGPQPYEVRMVIYDPSTLAPLVPAGSVQSPRGEAVVGDVYITQSSVGRPVGQTPNVRGAVFGGGDDFDTLEFDGVRWGQDDPSAGPLSLDLLWKLHGFTGTTHRSTLTVLDERGYTWAQESRPLFGGTFNFHDWRNGETLAERRSLDLTTLPVGRYRLLLAMYDANGQRLPLRQAAAQVELASFSVPFHRPLPVRVAGWWQRITRLGR